MTTTVGSLVKVAVTVTSLVMAMVHVEVPGQVDHPAKTAPGGWSTVGSKGYLGARKIICRAGMAGGACVGLIGTHFYRACPGHIDRDRVRSGEGLYKLRVVDVGGGIGEAVRSGCDPICADRIAAGVAAGEPVPGPQGRRW